MSNAFDNSGINQEIEAQAKKLAEENAQSLDVNMQQSNEAETDQNSFNNGYFGSESYKKSEDVAQAHFEHQLYGEIEKTEMLGADDEELKIFEKQVEKKLSKDSQDNKSSEHRDEMEEEKKGENDENAQQNTELKAQNEIEVSLSEGFNETSYADAHENSSTDLSPKEAAIYKEASPAEGQEAKTSDADIDFVQTEAISEMFSENDEMQEFVNDSSTTANGFSNADETEFNTATEMFIDSQDQQDFMSDISAVSDAVDIVDLNYEDADIPTVEDISHDISLSLEEDILLSEENSPEIQLTESFAIEVADNSEQDQIVENEIWSPELSYEAVAIDLLSQNDDIIGKIDLNQLGENADQLTFTLNDPTGAFEIDFDTGVIRLVDSSQIDLHNMTGQLELSISVSNGSDQVELTMPIEYEAIGQSIDLSQDVSNIGFDGDGVVVGEINQNLSEVFLATDGDLSNIFANSNHDMSASEMFNNFDYLVFNDQILDLNATITSDYNQNVTSQDDIVIADGRNNVIHGGDGDDYINGGGGIDTINGGAGNDLLAGGNSHDTISGGSGDDFIIGGFGNDILTGGSGNDILHGDHTDDTIQVAEHNFDIAVFSGQYSDYNITYNEGTGYIRIEDMRDGQPDGIDLVYHDVEQLRFSSNEGEYEFINVSDLLSNEVSINYDAITFETSNHGANLQENEAIINVANLSEFSEHSMQFSLSENMQGFSIDAMTGEIQITDMQQALSLAVGNDGMPLEIIISSGDESHTITFDISAIFEPYMTQGNFNSSAIVGDGGLNIAVFEGSMQDYTFGNQQGDFVRVGFNDDPGNSTHFDLVQLQQYEYIMFDDIVVSTEQFISLSYDDYEIYEATSQADYIDAERGDDIVFAGSGDDNINGMGGDDALFGEAGDDVLAGGAGSDVLIGGAGNDTLIGSGYGSDNDIDIASFSGSIDEYQFQYNEETGYLYVSDTQQDRDGNDRVFRDVELLDFTDEHGNSFTISIDALNNTDQVVQINMDGEDMTLVAVELDDIIAHPHVDANSDVTSSIYGDDSVSVMTDDTVLTETYLLGDTSGIAA